MSDLLSRLQQEAESHQTVHADDRRRKALFAEAAAAPSEVESLRMALLSSKCPAHEYDVSVCMERGDCGCVNGDALARISMKCCATTDFRRMPRSNP